MPVVQAEAEVANGLRAVAGVRYETAVETVTPVQSATTRLKNDYFLPAGTLTWNFAADMQLRASGAKTISRPQFRELAPQQFRDPDSDRLFFGNPNLRDSELWNLEARYEWFYARDQRFTLAGFYKRIKNPIEQVGFYTGADDRLQTGFTYLPSATLYGAEVELQKYVPLAGSAATSSPRAASSRSRTTPTPSRRSMRTPPACPTRRRRQGSPGLAGCARASARAAAVPRRRVADGPVGPSGQPAVGHGGHRGAVAVHVAVQLCQQPRDQSRSVDLSGTGFQPDIVEVPGIRLDLVARQGFELMGGKFELKAEAQPDPHAL